MYNVENAQNHACCSLAESCLALCNHLDCSTPAFPVLHQFPELAQTHVHRVSDAIQPSHPLSSPSPLALNLSQHQGVFSESALHISWPKYWRFSFSIVAGRGNPCQGPRVDSCLTFGNELSEETHMLTKQESFWKGHPAREQQNKGRQISNNGWN